MVDGRWVEASGSSQIRATVSNESNPIDLTDLVTGQEDEGLQQPLPEIVIPRPRKPRVNPSNANSNRVNGVKDEARQDQAGPKDSDSGSAFTPRLEQNDSESIKNSVVSGLGSSKISEVYVPTNSKYHSKIMPRMVKLLDQGCAFVEGYSCASLFGGNETTVKPTASVAESETASSIPSHESEGRHQASKPQNTLVLSSNEENDDSSHSSWEIPSSSTEPWTPRGPFYAEIPGQHSLMEDTPIYQRGRRYTTPPHAPRPYDPKSSSPASANTPENESIGSPPMLPNFDGDHSVSTLSTTNQFPRKGVYPENPSYTRSQFRTRQFRRIATPSFLNGNRSNGDAGGEESPSSPRGVADQLQAQASTDTMNSWEKEQLVAILQNERYMGYYDANAGESLFPNALAFEQYHLSNPEETNQVEPPGISVTDSDDGDGEDGDDSEAVVQESDQSDRHHFKSILSDEALQSDVVDGKEEHNEISGTASEDVDEFFNLHKEYQDEKVHGYVYISEESEGEGEAPEGEGEAPRKNEQHVELWRRPSQGNVAEGTPKAISKSSPLPGSSHGRDPHGRDPSPVLRGIRAADPDGDKVRGKKDRKTKLSESLDGLIDLTSHEETVGPLPASVEEHKRVAALKVADRLRERAAKLKEKKNPKDSQRVPN